MIGGGLVMIALGITFLAVGRLAWGLSKSTSPTERGELRLWMLPIRTAFVSRQNRAAAYGAVAFATVFIAYGFFLFVATAVGWEVY